MSKLEDAEKDMFTALCERGVILAAIRDSKLYKSEYKTFDTYLKIKFNMSKGHAYSMLRTSEFFIKLKEVGIGVLPKNERQARAVMGTSLGMSCKVKMWQMIVAQSIQDNVKITGFYTDYKVEQFISDGFFQKLTK